MRRIVHPGSPVADRTSAVADEPVALRFMLEPGLTVDAAIAKGFAASGCKGGFVALQGGHCDPFRYVMPAASPDGRHAAWFSETFAPAGGAGFVRAGVIVGLREGKPFIHCHGLWRTGDGTRMGHVLAPETTVREPVAAEGFGFRQSTFDSRPDPETHFTLFEPARLDGDASAKGASALLAKIRPNEDVGLAIESLCASHGIAAADIYGIGSLNGVAFADGSAVASYATEVLIRHGRFRDLEGEARAELDIDVVDMDGNIASGRLVRGSNPVCVTFELVIVGERGASSVGEGG